MSTRDANSITRNAADLSRREWLLKLGEAAVLLGFSGTAAADPHAENMALRRELTDQALAALPPGLYEPSNDHLSHALTHDSLFHAIPPGAETDYARPRSGPYQPQFFSEQEFRTVQRIVELMLGQEESGRVAASLDDDHENIIAVVSEWIDLRVSSASGVRAAARGLTPAHRALAVAYHGSAAPVEELEKFEPERIAREGLAWLEAESRRRYGKIFLDLDEPQQIGTLREMSDLRPDQTSASPGARFFQLVKGEIIQGFYTSRTGLKELDYKKNAFYAESPGCPDRGGLKEPEAIRNP